MQLYSSKKKNQATTHVSESNPSRASSSALASSSFALSFSFASTGNQSCIRFMSAQSTFAIQRRAGKRKRPRDQEQKNKNKNSRQVNPQKHIFNNSHRFATTTDGALHIGHSSCPLFCIFTKHLTQNKWPQSNLIGLNAIFIQIKHT